MSFPPATELDAVIEEVRVAQREFDAASSDMMRLRSELEIASERLDRAGERLRNLRDKMYNVVVQKPWGQDDQNETSNHESDDIVQPIRVPAAWSDEGKGLEG